MRFKQAMLGHDLSIEFETENVPSDGRYHVVLGGTIFFSSPSKKKSLEVYKRERDRLFEVYGRPEPPKIDRAQWVREERAKNDIKAMRSEWLQGFGTKGKKGGRGGRGGI